MKQPILTAAIVLLLLRCSHDETKIAKHGNISFSLSQKARSDSRTSATATPNAALLSIKDSNGNSVYDNKKLMLTAFGQGYVSEGLQLNVGNYTLTQFIILNAGDTTIYATPLEGSDLAQYVDDPLPINFTITENGSTTVVPEVIAVEKDDKPESFGYVNFGFKIISAKVHQLVFTEPFGFIDSASFHYSQENVSSVNWKLLLTYPDLNSHFYIENRIYDLNHELTEIKGDNTWGVTYSYSNGNLFQSVINRGWDVPLSYYITKTFSGYSNGNPTNIKTESHIKDYVLVSSLEYENQNLVHVVTLDPSDSIKYDVTATYENELNPLRHLLETPLIQAYGYYPNDVFYYSKNLPKEIKSMRYFENAPYYEISDYTFSYTKNNTGQIISVSVNVHVTDNQKHEFLNGLAYTLNLFY